MSSLAASIKWSKIDSFVGNSRSGALTYNRPCPICDALKPKTIFEINDFQFFSDSSITSKRIDLQQCLCQNCYGVYLNPCFSDYGFNTLLSQAGYSYGASEGRPEEQIKWLESRHLLKPGLSVLDVGCYEGAFLSKLPESVLKMGVDIDPTVIHRAQQLEKNKGISFYCGDFETFKFDGPSPDIVTMFHVLEHLPRPIDVLKKLRSISAPTTLLVVEVPILENSETNDICGFFGAIHTTHFSRTSLSNCHILSGWEIIEVDEQPGYNGFRIIAKPTSDPLQIQREVIFNSGDMNLSTHYLENYYRAIKNAGQRLEMIFPNKQIILWGGGVHTEFLYKVTSFFQRYSESEFLIVDSDPLKQGKTWRGIEIFSPSVLSDFDWSSASLVISTYGGQESIMSTACDLSVPNERIIKLYDFVRRC